MKVLTLLKVFRVWIKVEREYRNINTEMIFLNIMFHIFYLKIKSGFHTREFIFLINPYK